MKTGCRACENAEVLASIIEHLESLLDSCDPVSDCRFLAQVSRERDNQISRWQEVTGEKWPERGP